MKMTMCLVLSLAACMPVVASSGADWPDLLVSKSGAKVTSTAKWESVRRKEVADTIIPVEYGRMPARPDDVRVEEVGLTQASRLPQFKGVSLRKLKVWAKMDDEDVTFVLWIWGVAKKDGRKWPVILEGDGCWTYLTERVVKHATERGWMVAQFNRCEVARDARSSGHSTLLKWAWAYHRAIDALLKAEPRIDSSRIAITGHSRGGKTVLLAGATDERVFAVGENASGCGGAGPCRDVPATAENIAKITKAFPYWFAPDWRKWAGREDELPFDQHFLLALVAPRKLFIRQGKSDLWTNPLGAQRTLEAASPVWDLYGKRGNIQYSLREGHHDHCFDDFKVFLDFLDANGRN